MAGTDPRMLFSWYSGEYCTDPAFAELEPELSGQSVDRAPGRKGRPISSSSGAGCRPSSSAGCISICLVRCRGAFLDPDSVLNAIVTSRKSLPPMRRRHLCRLRRYERRLFRRRLPQHRPQGQRRQGHRRPGREAGRRRAVQSAGRGAQVRRHPANLRRAQGYGDAYGGETFRRDFEAEGISYQCCPLTKSDLYEQFEPRLNAGEIELPNVPKLQEQLLGLVYRGTRVDHAPNEHDDFANAVAGACWAVTMRKPQLRVGHPRLRRRPHPLEEPLTEGKTHIRYVRLDEAGRELTPEEACAIRHTPIPPRRTGT